MRRWPLVASFVLFIALCATLAYWAMQFYKPPVRPVAAPPPSVQAPVNLDAAASLFGGKSSAAVTSNFKLTGVIMAGAESVAILAADGKPAQAVRVNREVVPGVKVKEVNRGYVVLVDNGVEKRVELPEDANQVEGVASANAAPVAATSLPARTAPAMPATVVNNSPANSSNPSSSTASAGAAGPAPNATANAEADTSPDTAAQSDGSSMSAATSSGPGGSSPASAAPSGLGMGSPPVTNQGSVAGSANPTAPAAPAVPGMPVTPRPPRP